MSVLTAHKVDLIGLEPCAEIGLGGPGELEIFAGWYSRHPWAEEVFWTAGDEPPGVWIIDRIMGFAADGSQVWTKVFSRYYMRAGETIVARIS